METSNQKHTLITIKILHAIVWAFFVLTILYILYSGIVDKINVFTYVGMLLILIEGIILLINKWRCPFTIMGEKYTDKNHIGFDIYLPKWLAKNNKTIFTTIYCISVIIVLYRLLT
jgi:hypothetical protein